MILRILSILYLLLFIGNGAFAQKKSKSIKRKETSISVLKRAELEAIKDPQKAIKTLNYAIELAKDENNPSNVMKAYILLGEINKNANLPLIAIQRYDRALAIAKDSNDKFSIARIQQNRGELFNRLSTPDAREAFRDCIESSSNVKLTKDCQEGLAISLINLDSLAQAKNILKKLEKYFLKKDVIALSRIQSLIAQINIKENDLVNANLNYSNSQSNFNRIPDSTKNSKVIAETQILIDRENDNIEKEIEGRLNNIKSNTNNPTYQTEQKIQLADAYLRKGDIKKAVKVIDDAEEFIKEKATSKTKVDFYKKSSELLAAKGDYEKALDKYRNFEIEQSKLFANQEKELNKKIQILEAQKNIDIQENIYSSKVLLGRSEKKLVNTQQYLIYLLFALLSISIISFFWIWRNLKAKNLANKMLELKSLRGQMNPHFIFNALNSVNEFIATQDSRNANKYLSKFSKLMRSVLEVNSEDLIPLSEELELTQAYLELEHARFDEKFDYQIDIEPSLMNEEIKVPPLLLQPYFENSIWHGLRYLDHKGKLIFNGKRVNGNIEFEIIDNGIGRTKSIALKTKHQKAQTSTGLKNTANRIKMIKEIYGNKYDISISDNDKSADNTGTKVYIKIHRQ